jgi:DNA invertase Pin-like site-specific DNA recombinase
MNFRANGIKFGASREGVDAPERSATAKRMKTDGHTARDIAKYVGVSRATLYRYLIEETAAQAFSRSRLPWRVE